MKKTNNKKTVLFSFPDESNEVIEKLELLLSRVDPSNIDDLIQIQLIYAEIFYGKDPETGKKVLVADVDKLEELNSLWRKYKS